MATLVTGASGFIGSLLVEELKTQGQKIYALSRHPPNIDGVIPISGDILLPNFGLRSEEIPDDIEFCYHLAGNHDLGKDPKGAIWKTNVEGTRNVLDFCFAQHVKQLYFASTAYTWPVNPYGVSKIENELDIKEYCKNISLKATIFKPSIVMGSELNPYPGHFCQFILLLIKVHRRAETIRRAVEHTLRLPILKPEFRIKGNPDGHLNLVKVDDVVKAMANIKEEGTFWLTNPNPPTLKELADWISDTVLVDVTVHQKFDATPIEAMFQKLSGSFSPYLKGHDLPSDLGKTTITKEYIRRTILRALNIQY